MRQPPGPARWIASAVLAVAALACLLAAAERWLLGRGGLPAVPPAAGAGAWLDLLPPPREVEPAAPPPPVSPSAPRRRADAPPPDWWEWAWRARSGSRAARDFAPAPAAPDSTPLLLARLGLEPGLLARARPDSALAARLAWLTLREGYLPGELRPVLRALGRAEAYRAIAAQAAAIYDEFLDQEILTPD